MNKKFFKAFGVAAACALATTAICAAPSFATGSATVNDAYVALKYHEVGQDPTICYIYRQQGYEAGAPQCDASYGSYDADTSTVTLKTAINDLPNTRVTFNFRSIDNIQITSDGNIKTNFYTASEGTMLILDFGTHTYTETYYQPSAQGGKDLNQFEYLGIKSGNLKLKQLHANGFTEIIGGDITITTDPDIAIHTDGFSMSGGSITSSTSGIFLWSDGDVSISGGQILAESIRTSGIALENGDYSFTMSGGTVNLKSVSEPAGFGIYNENEDEETTISGGELTIDGFDWGIFGKNNQVIFNGGTTTIKNSVRHTIWINPAKDPENDIVFGDNMGIKEDTYVFWEDGDDPSTGIADPETVTIAEGYTYRRHYGWEDIDSDSDSPSTPDTGLFSAANPTASSIVGAIIALPFLAIIGYVIRYAIKRNAHKVKFNH